MHLQPTDTTVVVSKDLTLSVDASCIDPLTYMWQKRCTEGEEEWERVFRTQSNTTDALFVISGVTESDAGEYRCLVRSKTGCSVLSQSATVTIISTGAYNSLTTVVTRVYPTFLAISDEVVSKFLDECDSAKDIDGMAASFIKEYGSGGQV